MNAFPSGPATGTRRAPDWAASMGGPLIVVPVSAPPAWGGCTEAGMVVGDRDVPDDYDRACAVDDLAGVIPVGRDGALALVLGTSPPPRVTSPRTGPSCGGSLPTPTPRPSRPGRPRRHS
nr:Imm21 family immunity protein [Streptomyces sp. MI02-7b]